jgi:translation elongation factor EF-4
VHGSSARNLCIAILISAGKNTLSFLLLHILSSTKLKKRAEQVLPESYGGGDEREGVGGKGEIWTKPCMHI